MKVLIAVPAFNEEKNIASLLANLNPWKKDVIIVDDGSDDHTAIQVKKCGFSCISSGINMGLSGFYAMAKDHAVKHDYTHLISIDADGQHEPRFIPEFIKALKKFDLVSGNRFHDVSCIPESKISSNLFAILLFKKFLNITLPDVACGFRAMNLTAITGNFVESRFGIIYDMLLRHSIAGKKTGFIRIPAIYHPDDPLNTKIPEIIGLLSTICKYSPSPELYNMINSVETETNFRINILGFIVEARYVNPGAYIFNLNITRARQFFSAIQQETI